MKINQEIIERNFIKLKDIIDKQKGIIDEEKNKNQNLSEKKREYSRLK
jgi:hypothetical protein